MLVAVGIFFIYEMFTVGDFGIAVNWNFFTSAWFWPLFVIGLVLAIVFWGKFGHWGGQPYDVYEDSNGNKVAKRNDDVVENMFWHFAFPILGHFILEPIIYGCLIYYPLMCVFALLGLILPYALAVILLAIPVLFFLSEKYTQNLRFRSAILIVVTAADCRSWLGCHSACHAGVTGSSPASSTAVRQSLVRQTSTRDCLVYVHKHFIQIRIRVKNFIGSVEIYCG